MAIYSQDQTTFRPPKTPTPYNNHQETLINPKKRLHTPHFQGFSHFWSTRSNPYLTSDIMETQNVVLSFYPFKIALSHSPLLKLTHL